MKPKQPFNTKAIKDKLRPLITSAQFNRLVKPLRRLTVKQHLKRK